MRSIWVREPRSISGSTASLRLSPRSHERRSSSLDRRARSRSTETYANAPRTTTIDSQMATSKRRLKRMLIQYNRGDCRGDPGVAAAERLAAPWGGGNGPPARGPHPGSGHASGDHPIIPPNLEAPAASGERSKSKRLLGAGPAVVRALSRSERVTSTQPLHGGGGQC